MEPIQKSELKKDKYKDPVKEERKRTTRTHKHRGTQRNRSNPKEEPQRSTKKRTQKESCAAKNYCQTLAQGGEDVLYKVQQLKNAENKTAT